MHNPLPDSRVEKVAYTAKRRNVHSRFVLEVVEKRDEWIYNNGWIGHDSYDVLGTPAIVGVLGIKKLALYRAPQLLIEGPAKSTMPFPRPSSHVQSQKSTFHFL